MATRVGPITFCTVPLNGHPRKPPGRPKHLRSICHTSRLIGDFVQILGSKFWALGAYIKNRRKRFCRGAHGEMTDKKWLDSIEKQKRRSNLKKCDRQTDRQTDGQTESIVDNNRLLGQARRSIIQSMPMLNKRKQVQHCANFKVEKIC